MKISFYNALKALIRSTLQLGLAAAMATSQAYADTYTVVDLTPDVPFSSANTISSGTAAGFVANAISFAATRATLWNGNGRIDLHPAFVDDPANNVVGRSNVLGSAQNVQVGWAGGPASNNRNVPVAWFGSADSVISLTIPFANAGGQALATDGNQIVGYGTSLAKDGTTFGPTRGLVWDVASGTVGDLGESAQAVGVGGGQQVGFILKALQNAALWRGTAKSLVNLHPKTAAVSVASATDGITQAGYVGYDVRVRNEAAKGNKYKRFNFATVWTGTAASALNIHPGGSFTHSFATDVKGQWIVGYGGDDSRIGTPGYYHALVWDAAYQATDLNAILPAPFIGSQALAVDGQGNVSGYMVTATGIRHAVVWVRNP